nr:hypothetical protein [Fodinibius sp.]
DNTEIIDCFIYAGSAQISIAGISISEVTDGVSLKNNFVYGKFNNAPLHIFTEISTNLNIVDNIFHNVESTKYAVLVTSASTGNFSDNRLYADGASTTLDPGSLKCTGNLAVNSIDSGGYTIPVDSTPEPIGSVFWVKKTVVSNTILTASPVDISGVATGELNVEAVTLKTDATGLAGGTNFQLKSDNARGNPIFAEETVANLGANVTLDMETFSAAAFKTVIENGKKLQVQSTVGDCTGTGEIDIYIKFSRVTAGATISVL